VNIAINLGFLIVVLNITAPRL